MNEVEYRTPRQNLRYSPRLGRHISKPDVASYLEYLVNNRNETSDASAKFMNQPLDWTPVAQLEREGYFPEGPYWRTDKVPGLFGFYSPYLGMLQLDSKKDAQGNTLLPRSIVAHEVGHANTVARKAKGWRSKIPGLRWEYPGAIWGRRYPGRSNPESIGYHGDSVDTLTNGVDRTKMPDLLRSEVDAWDLASGKYDPAIRDAALGTYRAYVADTWRNNALKELMNFSPRTPDSQFNEVLRDSRRRKAPVVGDSFKDPAMNTNEYDYVVGTGAYSDHPDVAEFWRTNTLDSARAALNKMNKEEQKKVYESSRPSFWDPPAR
jgi:hypothetical protein